MFIKMRESKGFTLVELMIVVAIIGILAAVAVPYYQKYIQKSRMTSKVFPGMHAIETNMATYYSFQTTFTGLNNNSGGTFQTLITDANTNCFSPTLDGRTLVVTIKSPANQCTPLRAMNGQVLRAGPVIQNTMITGWALAGTLAVSLGLAGEK